MYGAIKAHKHTQANDRDYHVAIVGASSSFGILVVEYFARVVQRSLRWCLIDQKEEDMRMAVEKLKLPFSHSDALLYLPTTDSPDLLQHVVQKSTVVIACIEGDRARQEMVKLAVMCAAEGTHFVSVVEHESTLRRINALHYLAKNNSCSLIPLCSRDVTMGELGLFTLSTKISPGALLDASIFVPLPSDLKSVLLESVYLAKDRLGSSATSKHGNSSRQKKLMATSASTSHIGSHFDDILTHQAGTNNFSSNSSRDSSPESLHGTLHTSSSASTLSNTPPTPTIEVSSYDKEDSYMEDRHLRTISSLDNFSSLSTNMRPKAKSYGDFGELSDTARSASSDNLSACATSMARSASTAKLNSNSSSRRSAPPRTRARLLPSMDQIVNSRRLVSQISAPTKSSYNLVVQKSLETTPTQLCPSRRSLAPLALSSTSLLPERNQGMHHLESHYLGTKGMASFIFPLLLKLFLFIFLLLPALRRFLPDSPQLSVYAQAPKQEIIARIKYYRHHSPTTMTPTALRLLDASDASLRPLSAAFCKKNMAKLVVGGLGSTSEYLPSSSTQQTEKLEFVEVRSPPQLDPIFSSVICTCLCAISLCHATPTSKTTGVVPPLTAGGKMFRDLLSSEGFSAASVSFGHK